MYFWMYSTIDFTNFQNIGTMGTGRWHSINMIVLFLIWYLWSNGSQMEYIAFR